MGEIGPVRVPRAMLQAQGRELLELAQRLIEFSGTGPTASQALAERQLERMRAVLCAPLVAAVPGDPSVAEVIAWMRARPGASWVSSAADVALAAAELGGPSVRAPGIGGNG